MSDPAAVADPPSLAADPSPRFPIEISPNPGIDRSGDSAPLFSAPPYVDPPAALADQELPGSRLSAAVALIRDALAAGPVEAAQMARLLEAAGVSLATTKRARTTLGVVSKKLPGAIPTRWQWQLPAADEPVGEPPGTRWLGIRRESAEGGQWQSGATAAGQELAAQDDQDDSDSPLAVAVRCLTAARQAEETHRLKLAGTRSELPGVTYRALSGDGDPDELEAIEAELRDLERHAGRLALVTVEVERLVGIERLAQVARDAERRRDQETMATRRRDAGYVELEKLMPHLAATVAHLVSAGAQLGDRGRTAQRVTNRLFEVLHRAGLRGVAWPPSQSRGSLAPITQSEGT